MGLLVNNNRDYGYQFSSYSGMSNQTSYNLTLTFTGGSAYTGYKSFVDSINTVYLFSDPPDSCTTTINPTTSAKTFTCRCVINPKDPAHKCTYVSNSWYYPSQSYQTFKV